jgi:hypothetical protein
MRQAVVEIYMDQFSLEEVQDEYFLRIDRNMRKMKESEKSPQMLKIAKNFLEEMEKEDRLQWLQAFFSAHKQELQGYIITPEFNTIQTQTAIEEFAQSINAKIEKL